MTTLIYPVLDIFIDNRSHQLERPPRPTGKDARGEMPPEDSLNAQEATETKGTNDLEEELSPEDLKLQQNLGEWSDRIFALFSLNFDCGSYADASECGLCAHLGLRRLGDWQR